MLGTRTVTGGVRLEVLEWSWDSGFDNPDLGDGCGVCSVLQQDAVYYNRNGLT